VILSRHVEGTVITWNAEDFKAPALHEAQERLEVAGAKIVGGIYAFDPRSPKNASKRRPAAGRAQALSAPRDTRKPAAAGSQSGGGPWA